MKLLIFSDIHNDWKTLERLLGVEADLYISAGDQVTWGKGLERCGRILQARGDKVDAPWPGYLVGGPNSHDAPQWLVPPAKQPPAASKTLPPPPKQ